MSREIQYPIHGQWQRQHLVLFLVPFRSTMEILSRMEKEGFMRLEARVNAIYNSLTANDREIVSHMFRDKQNIRHMNSTPLAQHLSLCRALR